MCIRDRKNTELVKYKAISFCMSDYFGFKLWDDNTVDSAENIFCMICHKSFAYHNYEICGKLTKIND